MIEAIITFSVRHRWAVIVAGVVLTAMGFWAARETPVDAIPDLSENQVLVFTEWPSHGPREIEDQVTYPVTLGLRGLAGVRVVRSSSDVGYSTVSVIFGDEVAPAEARRRVAERLAGIGSGLPPNVRPALGPDSPATGQIFWYTVEGGGLDLGRLRAVQDWYLRPQLGSVPGVAEVASVGGFPIEYQVAADPDRMRLLGVTSSDIVGAIAASNAAAAGHVVQKGNAEFVVRGVSRLGASTTPGDESFDPRRAITGLEDVLLDAPGGGTIRLAEVASVSIGPGSRRGVLEKDGSEVVGGVVLIARGENPMEVTRRIKARLDELRAGLPPGVKVVACYDRTPLIEGAIETVTDTVAEGMISASLCVLLILRHVRTSLAIAAILPVAALSAFLVLAVLRWAGILDVPANAMSLSGIAISIGVLIDSSVVMAENVMHRLKEHFGDDPVRGDVRAIVLPACVAVGRPIVFSVAIMLLSFLPVFAMSGIEGRMFRPLALTKTFALAAVAVLAVTLVPALCTVCIRGRLRSEGENPIVRGIIEVYRPTLDFLLDRPVVLAWIVAATFLLGFTTVGSRPVTLGILAAGMVATAMLADGRRAAVLAPASLVVMALACDRWMSPMEREFLAPLDEGIVMDMPITAPRASVAESVDDLKARDMVLCHFPEVDMVVGKAGRAETATDPAPMDMIETMVNFRPRIFWPRRKLRDDDARRQVSAVLDALIGRGAVAPPSEPNRIIQEATEAALWRFDAVSREYAHWRFQELARESGGITPTSLHPSDPAEARLVPRWLDRVERVDSELLARLGPTFTRMAMEQLLDRATITDPAVAAHHDAATKLRDEAVAAAQRPHRPAAGGHHHHSESAALPSLEPQPKIEAILSELGPRFGSSAILWRVNREELVGFGGELDRAVSMPGWTNVWTMPIQNRVDMLSTGVNTAIGIRVLGRDLDDVARAAVEVARVVQGVPGAVDVIADPIRGKPSIEIRLDRARAARLGVRAGDVNHLIETAMAGRTATEIVEGRERHPVVVRYPRARREDEESIRDLLVPARGAWRGPGSSTPRPRFVPLSEVAEVRVVEGPATIKGENGMLRSYVRLSARGRDAEAVVDDARRAIAREARLPIGVYTEFAGRFEHEAHARRTLGFVLPTVLLLIFAILYWTYHDLADAALMMLAVPGAIAGGLFFQWLAGLKLSITAGIGFLACFGMATSTGIIMLVYLREAIARGGGLAGMSLDELRRAVLDGAVHRLRPKLLTEGTVVLGLAPMLWSNGVASEVIRPMAAPVLGGILVADEVIDLLLPVLFYWVRRRRWQRIHARRPIGIGPTAFHPPGAPGP